MRQPTTETCKNEAKETNKKKKKQKEEKKEKKMQLEGGCVINIEQ